MFIERSQMFDRILRAIKMDKTIFAEVAKDTSLMNEATIIVVIVTIVGALGSLFLSIAFFGLGFLSFILAIINGIEYSEGESLDVKGYVLKSASPTKVVIENRGTGATVNVPLPE